ncbi:MAG: hypothetical protein ACXWJC_00075 [Croceibacterium sp.]
MTDDTEAREPGFAARAEPLDRRLTAALLVLLVTGAAILFYASNFGSGYAAFGALLAIPAAIGGLVSQIADPRGKFTPMGCLVWPLAVNLGLFGLAYAAFHEGAICIAMVLPLWLPASIAGSIVSQYNARRAARRDHDESARLLSIAWLVFPLVVVMADSANPPQWQEREVVRSIDIANSPVEIWPLLVSIPGISPEEGRATFTHDILGVPRPTEARLVREGQILVRKAYWGQDVRFDERITDIEPGRAIAWRFAFPDHSIELHTDRHIAPDGDILKVLSGRYRLSAGPGGSTRLTLTTCYAMRTRVPAYLAWWGETMLGDVEDNVLGIVHDRVSQRPPPLTIRDPVPI